MLQHNTVKEAAARQTHWAHAAVVGLHALCCGIPAAMAVTGAAMGALAWASVPLGAAHSWLHGYEPEMLTLSFILVAVGGFLEWSRRSQRRGLPRLYALSLVCFLANASIVTMHRLPAQTADAAIIR